MRFLLILLFLAPLYLYSQQGLIVTTSGDSLMIEYSKIRSVTASSRTARATILYDLSYIRYDIRQSFGAFTAAADCFLLSFQDVKTGKWTAVPSQSIGEVKKKKDASNGFLLVQINGARASDVFEFTSTFSDIVDTLVACAQLLSGQFDGVYTDMSVTGNGLGGNMIRLIGDEDSPGPWMYYGTDGDSTKGWYNSASVIDTSYFSGDTLYFIFPGGDTLSTIIQTVTNLNDLTDVDTTGIDSLDFLMWNGSAWVPQAVPPDYLNGLPDVDTASITPSDLLQWNGSSWIMSSPTEVVGDGGGAYGSGLADRIAYWANDSTLSYTGISYSSTVLDASALTGALKLPTGTDAQDPVWANGMLRYNSDQGGIQGYNGAERFLPWASKTAFTSGSVIFSDGSKLVEDNSGLYFDAANNELRINTSSDFGSEKFQVGGNAVFGSAGGDRLIIYGSGGEINTPIWGDNLILSTTNSVSTSKIEIAGSGRVNIYSQDNDAGDGVYLYDESGGGNVYFDLPNNRTKYSNNWTLLGETSYSLSIQGGDYYSASCAPCTTRGYDVNIRGGTGNGVTNRKTLGGNIVLQVRDSTTWYTLLKLMPDNKTILTPNVVAPTTGFDYVYVMDQDSMRKVVPADIVTAAGGTTGSGASGQVAYWNGTSTLTGSSTFLWDGTQLSVGTTNSAYTIDAGTGGLRLGAEAGDITGAAGVLEYYSWFKGHDGSNWYYLPKASSATFTAGSVIISDGSKLVEDNGGLYFDAANNELRINSSADAGNYGLQVWNKDIWLDEGLVLNTSGSINGSSASRAAVSGMPFIFNNNSTDNGAVNATGYPGIYASRKSQTTDNAAIILAHEYGSNGVVITGVRPMLEISSRRQWTSSEVNCNQMRLNSSLSIDWNYRTEYSSTLNKVSRIESIVLDTTGTDGVALDFSYLNEGTLTKAFRIYNGIYALEYGSGTITGTPTTWAAWTSGGKFVETSAADIVTAAGGTTGSGASGQVAYWNGASTLTGSSTFLWDGTQLSVGTTNSAYTIDAGTGGLRLGAEAGDITGAAGVLEYYSWFKGHDGSNWYYLPKADAAAWAVKSIPFSDGSKMTTDIADLLYDSATDQFSAQYIKAGNSLTSSGSGVLDVSGIRGDHTVYISGTGTTTYNSGLFLGSTNATAWTAFFFSPNGATKPTLYLGETNLVELTSQKKALQIGGTSNTNNTGNFFVGVEGGRSISWDYTRNTGPSAEASYDFEAARIVPICIDNVYGAMDIGVRTYTYVNNTLTYVSQLDSAGLILPLYASGTLTGTPTTWAAFNSSGRIIQTTYINDDVQAEISSTDTATVGSILPVDCSAGVVTIDVPSSPVAGDWFSVSDSRASAGTYNITIDFITAGVNLHGASQNYVMNANADFVRFTYVNPTIGWIKSN